MAAYYLLKLGIVDAGNGVYAPPLADHDDPVLPRFLRSQLLRRRAVDPRVLVPALGNREAHRHLHFFGVGGDDVLGDFAGGDIYAS